METQKVLQFAANEDEGKLAHRMIASHFPNFSIINCYTLEQVLEILTVDGPFLFLIFDTDQKDYTADEFFLRTEDYVGKRATMILTTEATMKSTVSSKMLNDPSIAVLTKPLKADEFKISVKQLMDWHKQVQFEESIDEFRREDLHPMKLRNFYLFEKMPYDVYMELTATKFGKIISKDKPYSHALIHSYAKRNVKQLYLKKDEFLKFLDKSIMSLMKAYHTKLSDRKNYILLHLKTAFFTHQYINALNVSPDLNALMENFVKSVTATCKMYDDLLEILNDVPPISQVTFAYQSIYTCYLCHFILFHLGWHADMSRDKLYLAAMLQDLKLSDEEMIKITSTKDPIYMNLPPEKKEIFNQHPLEGAKIADNFSSFTELNFIIAEHHEHPTGEGIPYGLNTSSITTISSIMIIACNYVSRMSSSHVTPEMHQEIYSQMKKVYNTGNFKEPLKALGKALKFIKA